MVKGVCAKYQAKIQGIPLTVLTRIDGKSLLSLPGGGCCISKKKKPKGTLLTTTTTDIKKTPFTEAMNLIKLGTETSEYTKILEGIEILKGLEDKDGTAYTEIVSILTEGQQEGDPLKEKIGEMLPHITVYLLQSLSDKARTKVSGQISQKLVQIENDVNTDYVGGEQVKSYIENFRKYVENGPTEDHWNYVLGLFQDITALGVWMLKPITVPIESVRKITKKIMNFI